MIRIENRLGTVTITQEYFANLVGAAASDSYGVVGMSYRDAAQGLRGAIFGQDVPDKGVRIRVVGDKLVIDLHIIVVYGVNISAIVKSIVHKVKYAVEETTGLKVGKVNVFVDGMKAE